MRVMLKDGIGPRTLAACQRPGAVYLHTVGAAASLLAAAVKEVVDIHKADEFG